MMEIKNWFTGAVICSGDTIAEAVAVNRENLSSADLSSADLSSADLSSANLSYADLRYADLSYANLRYADLSYADLSSADFRSANLRSANLRYANLRSADGSAKARLAWTSHDLLAEILRRAAGDDIAKLKVAGLVLMCREMCWTRFIGLRDPLSGWALGVLHEWVQEDDGAPDAVRNYAAVESEACP